MKIDNLAKAFLELLKIGKSTAKQIQISGDKATAQRIKKAVAKGDIAKIKKIVEKGGILVDGKDVVGIWKSKKPGEPNGVMISEDMLVNYIWMKRIIKRYKRKEG